MIYSRCADCDVEIVYDRDIAGYRHRFGAATPHRVEPTIVPALQRQFQRRGALADAAAIKRLKIRLEADRLIEPPF